MTRPFLVLGCPRSGTSLVAGILHQSGIVMGDRFAGTTEQNPRGFWEDPAIVAVNDLIFKDANTGHLEPPPRGIEAGQDRLNLVRKQLVDGYCPGGWGRKDSRIIFLWKYYEEILRSEFGGARIIATHRNPLHVAKSWVACGRIATDGTKVEVGLARGLWLAAQYEDRMTGVYESGYPVLHVAFEDWWRRPERQQERLNEFVGRELDFSLFDEKLWRS